MHNTYAAAKKKANPALFLRTLKHGYRKRSVTTARLLKAGRRSYHRLDVQAAC